jgi:O-antigen ligase
VSTDAHPAVRRWYGFATFWWVLVLLPVGRTAELPLLVLGVFGLIMAWRERTHLASDMALRLALALFASWWLPALISAVDAVEPADAWRVVGSGLRFVPFLVGAVLLLGGHERALARVRWLTAIVVALWTLDALVQTATGWSLAGRLEEDRISGVFGDENLKLGPALAVLSPVLLIDAVERYGRRAAVVAWLATLVAILLAGSRAGWVSFAVVTLVLLWRMAHRPGQFARWLGASALACGAVAVSTYALSDRFAARIDRTFAIVAGTEEGVDHALAFRLPIWRAGMEMIADHPINGVGVRSFRHAYGDHAPPGDRFHDEGEGRTALHAHQLLVEVLAETGVIGLAFWLAGIVLAWRAWRAAERHRRHLALPPGLALVAMLFPLNTHFAFYSSFWSLLLFWLVAWYCAALRDPVPEPA